MLELPICQGGDPCKVLQAELMLIGMRNNAMQQTWDAPVPFVQKPNA